jgi:hypothetical protein
MKLTVFNGSPRGKESNSKVLLDHFLAGFEATPGNSHELFYLNRVKQTERFVEAFSDAEHVLLAFPLYADAMPGQVMAFFEALEPLCGREGSPDLGFIVQSGFLEALRFRGLERYLEKLSARLGCRYVGTIIKGSCEAARLYPQMFRKLFAALTRLGKTYGETGQYDQASIQKLAKPERFSKLAAHFWQWMYKTSFNMGYFDEQLKENGAYEQRFARPYAE